MREFKERKKPSTSSDAFFKPTVQTKLAVGQAGDQYEQEADATADHVVNGTNSTSASKGSSGDGKPLASGISPVQMKEIAPADEEKAVQKKDEEKEPIQKKEDDKESVQAKEEEEATVQKKEEEEPGVQKKEEQEDTVQKKEEEEKPIQKKGNNGAVSPGVESRLSSRKGKGHALGGSVKNEMEKGFGSDFGDVRIHNDAEAKEMSRDMGAQAFTQGNDIYFNEGKFDPESKAGKQLLAHELTHTIQQKGMKEERQPFQLKGEAETETEEKTTTPPTQESSIGNNEEKTGGGKQAGRRGQGQRHFTCDTSPNPEFVNRSGTITNSNIGQTTGPIPFCNSTPNLSVQIDTNTVNPAQPTATHYQVELSRGDTVMNDQHIRQIGGSELHNFGRMGMGNYTIEVRLIEMVPTRSGALIHRSTQLPTQNVHVRIHF